MKIKYIVLCLLLALVGCQRDEEMEIGQVSVSNERLEASYSSVEISCTFQTNVTIKNVKAYVSTAQDFSSATSYSLTEKAKNTFGANIEGLKDASTYYVRYEISNRWSSKMVDDVSEFNTIPYTTPNVQTNEVTDVTYNSAIVGGTIAANGGKEITERGIVYSTNQNPTTADSKITNGSGLGEFTYNLTDLQDGTTYYVRAYAINAKGTAYGEEVSFTTKTKTIATVATTPATNVSYTSATVGGNVTDDGGASVTERGICYSTSVNPTISNTKIANGSGLGEFTCNLTELQVGVTYYARAYAVNEKGTAYGEEVSFTTKAKTVATVSTTEPTSIIYTSAVVGGTVTDDGGAEVTERGVVYSTSQNPTTSDNKVTSGSGTGSFSCNLTELQDGVTYYARAYAVNEKGTAYGEEVSFTILCPFSISSTQQVYFSPGNLQYTQSTNTWSFAANQWDYIGTENVTGGSVTLDQYGDSIYAEGNALADKIDLFGWSTSSTNFGVSTSEDYADYYGSFVDWGTNQIGADAPNTWRTLTKDEWDYLLNNRTNAGSLKGVAQVNGVNGLILLPDDWTCPAGIIFKSGFHSSNGVVDYAAYQTFTTDQWSELEGAGAVFLPAAGYRYGSDVDVVQYRGRYWSVTEDILSDDAYCLHFYSVEAYMNHYSRSNGHSVRLVKDL